MSSAWIGLIGVVVGGVISTLWQWLAVVRQELSAGMVAARLVDESLERTLSQDGATAKPDSSTWIENRVALATTLGHKRWELVADVYRSHADGSADAPEASRERVEAAREAIKPLVKGKRHAVLMRVSTVFH